MLWVVVIAGLIGVYHLSDQHIQSFERAIPFSYLHRIYIYRAVGELIHDAPFVQKLCGFGLDASRVVGQKKFTFESPDGDKRTSHISELIPLHPHNAVLQVFLELGVVGLTLLFLCLWRLSIQRKEEMFVLYVAACHALVSVGIWQAWWMASVWLAYWLASMKYKNGCS